MRMIAVVLAVMFVGTAMTFAVPNASAECSPNIDCLKEQVVGLGEEALQLALTVIGAVQHEIDCLNHGC